MSVGIRVNALELMVDQRHLHQRIERRALIFVDEALPCGHCGLNFSSILWRHVDDFLGYIILQRASRRHSKPAVVTLRSVDGGIAGIV